jgi:murein DD-endopeptidase MepM/ murein hydrolase activator NlpD
MDRGRRAAERFFTGGRFVWDDSSLGRQLMSAGSFICLIRIYMINSAHIDRKSAVDARGYFMLDPDNSRTRGVSKATIKSVSLCLSLSFLVSFLPAQISWSGENIAADAMKVAAAVPRPVYSARGDIEEAAEATISSVRGMMALMRQAQALSAMLPPKEPTQVPAVANAPAPAPKSEPEAAMLVAARTPNFPLPAAKKTETKAAAKTAQEPAGTKSKVSLPDSEKLIWPVDGYIYSAFNATRGRRKHGAIDIVTKKGVPIAAAADGIVSVASNGGKEFSGYGKIVILDHGKGLYTLYAHCDKLLVKMGQRVKSGEYIATVGRTGRATTDHCHFEVRLAGKKYDPLTYLPSRPEMVKATNYHAPGRKKK